MAMKVQYIFHSGVSVDLEDAIFIFDYWKGDLPVIEKGKKVFVFASHRHHDHFVKTIFEWQKDYPKIHYILSKDIRSIPKENERIIRIKAHEEVEVDGCNIRTLRSTDEGVAFLVSYKGKTIYHAGDLNWWHWEGETKAYNNNMKANYQREIALLGMETIDIAFVPLDPRLEEQYALGIDWYMRNTNTKYVVPIHEWDEYDLYDKLMVDDRSMPYRKNVQNVTGPGQLFVLP